MKKAFVLYEELGNGHHFEGENNIKLFATREEAVERMRQLYEEDLQMFRENYDEGDITASITIDDDHCRFDIEAFNWTDWCEACVIEQDIIGSEETMVAQVHPDYIDNHDYRTWRAMDFETICKEDGVEVYTLPEFQEAFNDEQVSDESFIFFYNI